MAVSPFKTFIAGEVLTASDLNSSFAQVFDNGDDLAWPATQNRDFDGFELILDSDGDSSIHVSTDDQLDVKLAGVDIFRVFTVSSAVNGLGVTGSATGNAVTLTPFGSDTDIDLDISGKGAGSVTIDSNISTTSSETTGNVVSVVADSLTTGKILNLTSDSADTDTRELVTIHNDNALATDTACLELIQDSTRDALFITTNANAGAMQITSAAETANVNSVVADSLTTGRAALYYSDSADTSSRELVLIYNDNSAATGTTVLEIRQDAAQDCLTLDQNGNGNALNIDAETTTANVVSINADPLTSGNVIDVSADGLTTGKIANFQSSASNSSTRELVTIHNDNALSTNTVCLEIIQDSDRSSIIIDVNGDARGIFIDSDSTTQNGLDIRTSSLTTGRAALFYSNSADTTERELVYIYNDNSASSGTIALEIEQDADATGLFIDQNGDGNSINIDSEATTDNVVEINADPLTSGNVIDVSADGLTTGKIANFQSSASNSSTRELVTIHNDNVFATGTICLELIQDADNIALFINHNANGPAIQIDAETTTDNTVEITSDVLTSGSALFIDSNSSSTNSRNICVIRNNNSLAVGATCLYIQQDADQQAVTIDQNGDDFALNIDAETTTANVVSINADPLTSGNVINVSADGLTSGKIANFVSNSSSNSTRELVTIHNNNGSATGTICLELIQDSDATEALVIDNNADSIGILIASSQAATFSDIAIQSPQTTSAATLAVTGGGQYTTGSCARFSMNSSSVSERAVVDIIQDHASATNASCIDMQQDGDAPFLRYSGSTGADASSSISTLTSGNTRQGFVQIEINGTRRWVSFYSDPTS